MAGGPARCCITGQDLFEHCGIFRQSIVLGRPLATMGLRHSQVDCVLPHDGLRRWSRAVGMNPFQRRRLIRVHANVSQPRGGELQWSLP